MKAQQKIDKILDLVNEKIEEEVSALIGVDFKLADFSKSLISKQDYFEDITGKKILAQMDLKGDLEGQGCIVVDVKDGIRLGGILIMLPQSELEEVVQNESYTEETEDSYGEIANIISGSLTKVFEENHPKSFRFVRKEQEIIIPAKVEVESDSPVPDQYYYLVRGAIKINDNETGDLDFLLPAEPFGIEIPEKKEQQVAEETEESSVASLEEREEKSAEDKGVSQPQESAESSEPPAASDESDQTINASLDDKQQTGVSGKDTAKNKTLVDKLLTLSSEQYANEVSSLLGLKVTLSNPETKFVDKEGFFYDEVSGKQVIAHFDIVDGLEGKSHLFISLKDAIRIGSILIMLPPSELETVVSEEDFSPDVEDAYGEIANIISGGYTAVFQEQYTESIRFVKKEIESVTPMKVDVESDDVISLKQYYLNSYDIEIDGLQCGKIGILLPADLFGLIPDENKNVEQGDFDQGTAQADNDSGRVSSDQSGNDDVEGKKKSEEKFDILLIQNNSSEAQKIADEVSQIGISCKTINYNDTIKNYISEKLRLVIIVMNEVDEQSYGVTIKVNTLSSVPIVAASNQWTRTKVIKAVKYGISDILLTPAAPDDIKEKLQANMLDMAA